jgi:hypothetical protein
MFELDAIYLILKDSDKSWSGEEIFCGGEPSRTSEKGRNQLQERRQRNRGEVVPKVNAIARDRP